MQDTKAMSREEIYENVKSVLEEALGADAEDITMEASLTGDLDAESIDFLDIVFRLEKTFSFKISQGELFPENLMENPDWVNDGKFTSAGMAMLRERMPHVDFSEFEKNPDVNKVAESITVKSLVDFVERKLKSGS